MSEKITVYLFDTDDGIAADTAPDEEGITIEMDVEEWEEYLHASTVYHMYQKQFQRRYFSGDYNV